jgi:repressor LexA
VDAHVARGVCFALEVAGNSMIDANIHNGDYVIVRQQPLAESGDIVVAMRDGAATVKRLYIADDRIELRPENKKMKPIPIAPDDDFSIVGKVVSVCSRKS